MTFDSLCVDASRIALEENDSTINVLPRLAQAGRDTLLVMDPKERQVRLYARDGKLLDTFGHKGDGPREFQNPAIARWIGGTSQVLVAELAGNLKWFNTPLDSLEHSVDVPGLIVYGGDALSDSTLLMAGRVVGRKPDDLLHVVDSRTGAILRSFFPVPPVSPKLRFPLNSFAWAAVTLAPNRTAAVFSLSDTLYEFSRLGTALRKTPLHAMRFRPPKSPPPRTQGHTAALDRWISSFSEMEDVQYVPGRGFLVQYANRSRGQIEWSLIGVDLSGHKQFEIADAPKLLLVDRQSGTAFFQAPAAMTPNRLVRCESLRM